MWKFWIVLILLCGGFANAFYDDSARLRESFLPSLKDLIKPVFRKKCIDDLGCFYTGPPFFHPRVRPISLSPADKLDTEFILFTPSNRIDPQILTPSNNSLKTSVLDPNLDTKIIIHGYDEKLNDSNIYFDIKDELMENYPSNIMIVNWTTSNRFPYAQAVANARAVGAQVAKFINYHVANRNVDPGTVYVIGHSLGGQMSGYIGERVPGLGRITALDPAGPFFYKMPKEVRLDPSDAKFVDVIHTDGGNNPMEGYGLNAAVGHMDFYPNGGKYQPGCIRQANRNMCEHQRSRDFFKESIKKCEYPAVQCKSYEDFTSRKCTPGNSRVAQMGYHATKLPVSKGTRFYLRTSTRVPYCGDKIQKR